MLTKINETMIIDRSFVLPPDNEFVAKNNVIIHDRGRKTDGIISRLKFLWKIFGHSFHRELDGAILHLWKILPAHQME